MIYIAIWCPKATMGSICQTVASQKTHCATSPLEYFQENWPRYNGTALTFTSVHSVLSGTRYQWCWYNMNVKQMLLWTPRHVYWSMARMVYTVDVNWDDNVVTVMELYSLAHRKLSNWQLPAPPMAKLYEKKKILNIAHRMNEDFLKEEMVTSSFLYDNSNQRKLL